MSSPRPSSHKVRAAASLLCSAAVIGFTALSLAVFLFRSGDGNMTGSGARAFRYYTMDSNLLAALACGFTVRPAVRGLRTGVFVLPRAVRILKYAGSCTVGLTFAVVAAFLGQLYGYRAMFEGMNLYLHLINPLLAMGSFLLLEGGEPLERRSILWGILPTPVYGAVYLAMVKIVKLWPDFYGFDRNGLWYVSLPAVLLGAAAIAALLRAGHNAMGRKETNSVKEKTI